MTDKTPYEAEYWDNSYLAYHHGVMQVLSFDFADDCWRDMGGNFYCDALMISHWTRLPKDPYD